MDAIAGRPVACRAIYKEKPPLRAQVGLEVYGETLEVAKALGIDVPPALGRHVLTDEDHHIGSEARPIHSE
jgi:hypothetical protein